MTTDAKILIVDDNPQNIQLAAAQLRAIGVHIGFARSGEEALQAIDAESFDLLLLDVMMPGMDGFELAKRIKDDPRHRDVPIMFLTARDDKESVLYGFEVGAVDYIAKPFYGPELVSRVRTHIRLRKAIAELERTNLELARELLESIETEEELRATEVRMADANIQLREQATRDVLTGLANRRHISSLAEYEHDRLARTRDAMAIVICDIDLFKSVNDDHGHDCGDVILREVARSLLRQVRRQDQVGRWGGEEFLILLPATRLEGALTVAEKMRAGVERETFSCGGASIRVTLTFGASECGADDPLDEAIRAADQALLRGKRTGRNRVVSATDQ